MIPSAHPSRRAALPLALMLALLPAAACADTPIDETRPVSSGASISIDNLKGRIDVSRWDRQEVHVGGSLGEGVEKLEIDGSGNRLSIKVRYPESRGGWFGRGDGGAAPTTLEVRVPADVTLDIESVSAAIAVNGTTGKRLEIESVSGGIDADASAGEVEIETVSGDQELTLQSRDVSVSSVSGDVRVRGAVEGRVHAEAVSGSLRIEASSIDSFEGSTVSGDITIEGALRPRGRVRVEALSGDIDVRLGGSPSAKVSASSFSGSIRSDVGTVDKEEYGPGTSLEATVGNGEGEIEVETFSGDIELQLR